MNRTFYISAIGWLALLMTACNSGENEPDGNNLNDGNASENETAENNNEENNSNEAPDNNEGEGTEDNLTEGNNGNDDTNDNNNEETNNGAGEEEVQEDTDPLYELHDDFSVRPIDDADEQVVLLTIDDAPDSYAVEMAEILTELDAGAIFFVNGHFIQSEEGQEQLQEIYDMGFEIGNHTMTHANLSDLSEEEQYEEIIPLNDMIEDITGERPRFFRAPFGVNTDYSKELMEEEDMQWMNWTYGYDYIDGYLDADSLGEIMVDAPELRDGANLLMHDREWTRDALETIVAGLRDNGYDIVDPELIK